MATDPNTVTDLLGIFQDSDGPHSEPVNADNVVPVIGISDLVIFPGMTSPFKIETPRDMILLDDVMNGNNIFGIILQKNKDAACPVPDDLWEHGCLVKIIKLLDRKAEEVRLLIEGLNRFKIEHFTQAEPYLKANISLLKDEMEDARDLDGMVRQAKEIFRQFIQQDPKPDKNMMSILEKKDPSLLTNLMAGHLDDTSVDDKQNLLETLSVERRLRLLVPLLEKELAIKKITSSLQRNTMQNIQKKQEFHILNTRKTEIDKLMKDLGFLSPDEMEVGELRKRIREQKLPPEAQAACQKEINRLQHIPSTAAEYAVSRSYIECLVDLPWNQSTKDELDLKTAEKILDNHHYGLEKVKERLLEFLAVMKLKELELKGPILCLVGPPGVGKTSLGQSMAEALGRKFAHISLGGVRDEAEIRGHRRTYVGSMPGRIIQALQQLQSNNPVILLDEFDKMSSDPTRGDPAAVLLEVLDHHQNSRFTDHYLDVPFDLSRVLFIATANWLEPIRPALRDRLEVINLPSYTPAEKLLIAEGHLIPKLLQEHHMDRSQIKLNRTTIKRLINSYTREAGVRQLGREIAAVLRKVAKSIGTENERQPIKITKEWLTQKLGAERFPQEAAETIEDCGIAIGLAWTPVGGEVLYIEATQVAGTGRLILTGLLGEVMKESAQAAYTYLLSQKDALGLKIEDADKLNIHIHVPTGAQPKDGPSTGITIAVALASLFSRRRIRSDLAMTGEVSLRGRVLPVGGIREKILAAFRSGIKTVIIPDRNRNDWNEIADEIKNQIEVRFVKTVAEVIQYCLLP